MSTIWARDVNPNPRIEQAKTLMVKRLSLLFFIAFLGMTIVFWNEEFYAWMGYFLAFCISIVANLYLYFKKQYRPLFFFYAFFGTLLAHMACNFSLTTSHYVDFLWMAVCSFLAFIGLGKKWGLFFLIFNMLGIIYFFFFTLNVHIEIMTPMTTEQLVGAFLEVILAIIILAYLLFQFIWYQELAFAEVNQMNKTLLLKNDEIEEKNKENITLLKEVHHRVKNNLQIITSLLRLQNAEKNNPEVNEQFKEAINRIRSMALIHEKLYQQQDISQINLKEYLLDLSDEVKTAHGENSSVKFELNTNLEGIDLKTIVPVGLILTELMSNSLKHGLKNQLDGLVIVTFEYKQQGVLEMIFQDNGKGFDPKNEKGFGTELIDILTEQLNGSYELDSTNGAKYQFKFNVSSF